MTEAKTKVNYTDEMVELILNMYAELGNEGLDRISIAVGKPVRSIRSKLVREGVYVATPKGVKAPKEDGPTKKELLAQLAPVFSAEVLDGLMPATKVAIAAVIEISTALDAAMAKLESLEDVHED